MLLATAAGVLPEIAPPLRRNFIRTAHVRLHDCCRAAVGSSGQQWAAVKC